MNEHCSICGYVMKKDSVSGKLSCLWCGNDFGITDETAEGTYEEARSLVRAGGFDRAIKILNGLDQRKTEVLLLNLLCCYQASDAVALAQKVSSSSSSVLMLAERQDVKQLINKLRIRKNDLIIHLMEYCFCVMALSGADMNSLRTKLSSMNMPSNKPQSAFAKMDSEEQYNDKRTRTIREAAEPPEKYPGDFLNTPPKRNYGTNWEEPVDSMIGNILLDILDMLIYDCDRSFEGYRPELLSHVRRYIAQNRDSKVTDRSDVFEGSGNDDVSTTAEDVKSYQNELMEIILEEEKAILDL